MSRQIQLGNCKISLSKQFDLDDFYSGPLLEVFVRGSGYWTENPRWLTGEELAKAYIESGTQLVDQIDGFFLVIILDKRAKKVVVITDHLNFFPLYYDTSNLLFFSDSLSPFSEKSFDRDGLYQYFTSGSLIGNRTIFKNVKKLPPASRCFLTPSGELKSNLYWKCRPVFTNKKEFKEIFSKTIGLIPKLSRRPSLSLTAGLDSRMVFSELQKQGVKFETFTFGYRGATDVKITEKISLDFNTPHKTYDIGTTNTSFLSSFESLLQQIQKFSDGMISGINTIHTLYSFLNLKGEHDMVVTATGELMYSHYAEVPTLHRKDKTSIESISKFLTEFNSCKTTESMLSSETTPHHLLKEELAKYSFANNQHFYDAYYLTKLSGLTGYIQQISGTGTRFFNPIFTKNMINHSIGLSPELRTNRSLQRDLIVENNPKLNDYLVNGFKVVKKGRINFIKSKINYALRLSQKVANKFLNHEFYRLSYVHYPSLLKSTQIIDNILRTKEPRLRKIMNRRISRNLPSSFMIKYASLKNWLDRNQQAH